MRWTFHCGELSADLATLVCTIPGVSRRGRQVSAPENTAALVRDLLTAGGARFDVYAPDDAVRRAIRGAKRALADLQPWVPDFLTEYQRRGVGDVLAMPSGSGMLVWSAGCLAGAMRLTVNRGGKAFRIALADLVHKFNGGMTPRPRGGGDRRWDLSIPTRTQSVDAEGFVRLNTIVAAYSNGVSDVFTITTASGRQIMATNEHRFMLPDGSFAMLADLRVGDCVRTIAWPAAGGPRKAKPYYRQIGGMWNHPFAVKGGRPRKDRPGPQREARVPEHRAVMEATLSGLPLVEFIARVREGETAGLTFLDPAIVHVHHKNEDTTDNRAINLEVLDGHEHLRGHGERAGWQHVAGHAVADRIVYIAPHGPQEVFDLGMADPLHNYVANDFAVHNSGKTLGAIVWALCSPARIVTVTKAAIKLQWAGEIERYAREIRPLVIEGETPSEIPISARWLVLSYEILPAWIAELECWARGRQVAPSLVLDESQKVQSHKRWDAVVDARAAADAAAAPAGLPEPKVKFSLKDNIAAAAWRLSKIAGRRLATTATPIGDRVRNLWAQLDLIHPGEWGRYWEWAARYAGATENRFGGMDDSGASNLPELKARLAAVTHRVKHSEANRLLPPKRRIVTYVAIADQVRAAGFDRELKAAAKHGATAVLEVRLMEAAARKRRRLLEKVEMAVEGKQKVCVFTGRRKDCDQLRSDIARRLGSTILVTGGHGGDTPADRERSRILYMGAASPAVLVGTTDAWGEGLNLQDTDLGLVGMLPYTPGKVVQLEGRWARLGQKRPVLVEYVVAEGTVDEHVAGILLKKLPAVTQLVEQDEVAGFASELSGADDPKVMESIAKKLLAGFGVAEPEED